MKLVLYPEVESPRFEKIVAAAAPMQVVNCSTESEAVHEIAHAEAFFGRMTPAVLESASRLRWVQSPTASLEHYVFPALIEHPLQLTNMRGLFHDSIADHVFGYMLCFARNLHHYIRQQTHATWKTVGGIKLGHELRTGPAVTTGVDRAHTTLASATLGVVGLGSIGSEIARRGVCFGMRVLAVDPEPREPPPHVEGPWGTERLDDLLAESDYVVICAPHTPETEKLFRARQFSRMKSSGVLINIARGVIVDLGDLTAALQSGEIRGAALDVYEVEPLPAEHPLWRFENVILTPHIAGHSPALAERHLDVLLSNVRSFKSGMPLRNVVDKQRWY